ncbi:MAG: hypothetical protein HPY46_08275, partial [Candidatus Aminicenantes bacterium]|nr:hypothetical protein [Candidatus Aminicenantes bacterium]
MRHRFYFMLVGTLAVLLAFNLSCSPTPKKTTVPKASERIRVEENNPAPEAAQPQAAASSGETNQAAAESPKTEPEIQDSPAQTEEVYSLIQEAQVALEKGELDRALNLLDQAYSVLLRIEAPPDSDLYQEKNDLRIMLVQKIQQVYAFRLPAPISNHKTIPLVENNWVEREIKGFQTVEKKFFEEAYRRAGLYRPMIMEELKKAGL